MKLALCLLALLPIVFSAPMDMEEEKRIIVGKFSLTKDQILEKAYAALGSDATEKGCEHFCHGLSHGLDFGLCGTACKGLQAYIRTHHHGK